MSDDRSLPATDVVDSGLTARELQIVEHVAEGLTTQRIAAELDISTHTVVTHVRHVYAKWGVTSRHELRARYSRLRWGG